ncbi:LPS export ABC transporter periplasmic protein LptC [Candidatus Pelagibacter sp.]|nr:LPS export ABC transporter periplasmic protein LptC [Candidatus Pelagibacter sp.]
MNKKLIAILVIIFILIISSLSFFKNDSKKNLPKDDKILEKNSYSSNIIENVKYSSSNIDGNEYIITALEGEIDLKNNNIIYLTKVKATIKLNSLKKVFISSDFGKYNINNFDTIFSENILINYLDNEIRGEYLDFSIKRNSLIISQNVIYSDTTSTLKTDVVEMNMKTKDVKFFMYNKDKKINLESKN